MTSLQAAEQAQPDTGRRQLAQDQHTWLIRAEPKAAGPETPRRPSTVPPTPANSRRGNRHLLEPGPTSGHEIIDAMRTNQLDAKCCEVDASALADQVMARAST